MYAKIGDRYIASCDVIWAYSDDKQTKVLSTGKKNNLEEWYPSSGSWRAMRTAPGELHVTQIKERRNW